MSIKLVPNSSFKLTINLLRSSGFVTSSVNFAFDNYFFRETALNYSSSASVWVNSTVYPKITIR